MVSKSSKGRRIDHPLYGAWRGMKQRCRNPNHHAYHNYGGRGITICSRWNEFWNFVDDMGERPEGYTLDRIDNDGNYEPTNCRWADISTQRQNIRAKGYSFDTKTNKYRAYLKRKVLGYFETEEEASEAYWKARNSI